MVVKNNSDVFTIFSKLFRLIFCTDNTFLPEKILWSTSTSCWIWTPCPFDLLTASTVVGSRMCLAPLRKHLSWNPSPSSLSVVHTQMSDSQTNRWCSAYQCFVSMHIQTGLYVIFMLDWYLYDHRILGLESCRASNVSSSLTFRAADEKSDARLILYLLICFTD